jgi:predicted Zn-dependent protease with MMP-like domain
MSKLSTLTAPTLDDFERMAREEFDRLPSEFRSTLGDVVFTVQDFAEDDVLDEMDAESPFELTGLFVGQELGAQDANTLPREPSMVFLYRVPILAEWAETGVELGALISHVIVHEIGHHFGLSDEDMERIESEAN